MREGLLFSQIPMMSYDSIQSAFNSLAPCTDRPVKIECVCMCVCGGGGGGVGGCRTYVRGLALIIFHCERPLRASVTWRKSDLKHREVSSRTKPLSRLPAVAEEIILGGG